MTDAQMEAGTGRGSSAVITDARMANSVEMSARIRRYTITMAFRMACFVGMFFVEGTFRWVLLGGAVVLPYIAVLFANQANKKTEPSKVNRAEPTDLPQLTRGESIEIVSGDVIDDEDDEPVRRVA